MIFKKFRHCSLALIIIGLSNASMAAETIYCRAFDNSNSFPQGGVFEEKVYIAVPQIKLSKAGQKDDGSGDIKARLSDEYIKFFVKREDWPTLRIDSHGEMLLKGSCSGISLYALVVPLSNIKIVRLPKRTAIVDVSNLLTHIDDMNFSNDSFETFK
jgi:hypothetical protein